MKQVSCGQPVCKKKQKNKSHTRWKTNNKAIYNAGQKDWRLSHPDYWKKYRTAHSQYTTNNRQQSKIRKALSIKKTGLQKRIDILQPLEKQMKFWCLRRFAKENRSLTPLLYAIRGPCKIQTMCSS